MNHQMKSKHTIFAQIRALDRRKHGKLNRWVIIDSKGKVVEKYRIKNTADKHLPKLRKDYFEELKIVELDENGKPVFPNQKQYPNHTQPINI